jgi:hypothetical protein
MLETMIRTGPINVT